MFNLGWSDYGFRSLDLQTVRFISSDPLSSKFPELTNYQYASNNPILNIDLDGLEGVRYDVTESNSKGKPVVKTIAEVNVQVGISKNGYSANDVSSIKSNLEQQYNNGFKVDGKQVEFRFNMQTFDADSKNISQYAKEVRKATTVDAISPSIKDESGNPMQTKAITTVVVAIDPSLSGTATQGSTNVNATRVNAQAEDIRHTEAHEIGHFMLNGNTNNPSTPSNHASMGGIFTYKMKDENGNIIQNTQNVNKSNVKEIIKTMPIKQ